MIECTRPGPQWWKYGWNPSFTSKDIEKHVFGIELSEPTEAGSHWRKKMCHSKSVNHPLVLLWTIFLDIRSPQCSFSVDGASLCCTIQKHLWEPISCQVCLTTAPDPSVQPSLCLYMSISESFFEPGKRVVLRARPSALTICQTN